MCGRTACTLNPSEISQLSRYQKRRNNIKETTEPQWKSGDDGKYSRGYNIAPQSFSPVLINSTHIGGENGDRSLVAMKWGLIPSWTKDIKSAQYKMSNARSDGILTKSSFKVPLKNGHRCVVLCEGFYEWNATKNGKQPYFIYLPHNKNNDSSHGEKEKPHCEDEIVEDKTACVSKGVEKLLAMAGIFELRKMDDGEELFSYAIITVDSHKQFSWLHHRMPAILKDEDEIRAWLDYKTVPLKQAINKCINPTDCLTWHPVSSLVNNSRNNSPECMKKINLEEKPKPVNKLMAQWLSSPSIKSQNDLKINKSNNKTVEKNNKKRKAQPVTMDKWLKRPKQ